MKITGQRLYPTPLFVIHTVIYGHTDYFSDCPPPHSPIYHADFSLLKTLKPLYMKIIYKRTIKWNTNNLKSKEQWEN